MSAADLARLLEVHRTLGGKILRGERQLTLAHVGTRAKHFGLSAYFRMAADLPCASRLSISANFCTAFCAFFSAARLYSTMLVRRWN